MTEQIEIGRFKLAKDGGWEGEIDTLTVNKRRVRLAPNDNRVSDSSPAFRMMLGRARIGRAWEARSRGENPRDYLRVRFDDPMFHAETQAVLFFDAEGVTGRLLWSRPSPITDEFSFSR